ncbi:hypothetical protein BYT27DRAFT_7246140 [Phlegmacium glaucopus]|nr:hypothetical protein BYT27DRAFT_7246140 [Phlegmacium glaucopus]
MSDLILFSLHLASFLTFLPALMPSPIYCGPTLTVGRPFPGNGAFSSGRRGVFVFPLPSDSSMLWSLSEARLNMVKQVSGWTDVILHACLEGWPFANSSWAETDDPPALYEQSLDWLTCVMGRSYDWRYFVRVLIYGYRGQLCTSISNETANTSGFGVLIPALEDPEPIVHAHAAAAPINLCEGVERNTLLAYLDPTSVEITE